jgi:hypothetical protein
VAGKGGGDSGGVCSIAWCGENLRPRPSRDLTFVGKICACQFTFMYIMKC